MVGEARRPIFFILRDYGWAHTAFPSAYSKGSLRETWRCERCGRQDERIYRPTAR